MGTFSDSKKNVMLDAVLVPGAVWAKLHNGPPGALGVDNAAGDTRRMECELSAPSAGTVTVTNELRWNAVTTQEAYSWVSFWTAEAAGEFIGSDDLPVAQAVNVGDNFYIPAGDVEFTI